MNAMKNNWVEEEQVSTLNAMNKQIHNLLENDVEVMNTNSTENEEEERIRAKRDILPEFDSKAR